MGEHTGDDDLVRALEDDLAALAAADADLERDAEVAERTRIERGQVLLRDRLRAARGYVHLTLLGGSRLDGPVTDVGDDWVVVAHVAPGHSVASSEHLVRLEAVASVVGLGGSATVPFGGLPPRPLAAPLRSWCRDRSDVTVLLLDGTEVSGRASATYADHLEVAAGPERVVAVPFAALAAVGRGRV